MGCVRHYLGWVGVGGKTFWVDGGGCENILDGWGGKGVSGTLFWVGGGGWTNILGKWGWIRVSECGWSWVGVGALFDNAHSKRINYQKKTP